MISSSIIIDGRKISQILLSDLKNKIESNQHHAPYPPKLAIILLGNDPASAIYVQNKVKAASKVGILTELIKHDSSVTESQILRIIKDLNADDKISGIIVQLPLPDHIDASKIMFAIDPSKDVDGFHPMNIGLLYSQFSHNFVPCTARACLDLIKHCLDDLSGKKIVVVGRSNIVGRPLSALLLKENATVTICHSYTENLSKITSEADIVVSAVGKKPEFMTEEYFNSEAIVIDVGINRIKVDKGYKLVGDVDFENVKNKVKYITPVPGGVGPMTVAYLLINTYKASLKGKE